MSDQQKGGGTGRRQDHPGDRFSDPAAAARGRTGQNQVVSLVADSPEHPIERGAGGPARTNREVGLGVELERADEGLASVIVREQLHLGIAELIVADHAVAAGLDQLAVRLS